MSEILLAAIYRTFVKQILHSIICLASKYHTREAANLQECVYVSKSFCLDNRRCYKNQGYIFGVKMEMTRDC